MAVFVYSGRGRTGEGVGGRVEADSAQAAAAQLHSGGITPVKITPHVEESAGVSVFAGLRRSRVTHTDLTALCRQLYTLTRAGIPILRAIHGLAQTATHPTLAETLEDVADGLRSGRDLATSLQRHAELFPPLMIAMVRVGEDSGRLEESFLQVTEYLERDLVVRKQIKSATRYPAFMGVALVVAMAILNVMVIPAFAQAFSKLSGQLPLPTRIMIGISDFSVAYGWYVLAVSVAAAYGTRGYLRTPAGRLRWDRAKLKLPIFGSIIERGTVARFARSFAMTLRSGVSLTQSLTLVASVVDNEFVKERILGMRGSIERGETLSQVAAAAGIFTPLTLQMISVGEESGEVELMAQEVAEFYEREVEYDVARIGDSIEPIMISAIGAVVLLLALGIYLPMWDLAAAIKGG